MCAPHQLRDDGASGGEVPPNPFGGNLPSAGYRSTSGAHGEIWLTETPGGEYELNFQLVSAPIRR
jgi:hypothetical protein